MIPENLFTFQKTLLDIATKELTSHGAMLFAGLISSIHFVRIVQDNFFARKRFEENIPSESKIIFLIISTILFGFSFYVIERLIFWGRLLHTTSTLDPLEYININFFKDFLSKTMDQLSMNLPEWSKPFLLRGKSPIWPFLRLYLINLTMGSVITGLLLYAIGVLSKKDLKWSTIIGIISSLFFYFCYFFYK